MYMCTLDKSLSKRYQKNTAKFNWSPCKLINNKSRLLFFDSTTDGAERLVNPTSGCALASSALLSSSPGIYGTANTLYNVLYILTTDPPR